MCFGSTGQDTEVVLSTTPSSVLTNTTTEVTKTTEGSHPNKAVCSCAHSTAGEDEHREVNIEGVCASASPNYFTRKTNLNKV